ELSAVQLALGDVPGAGDDRGARRSAGALDLAPGDESGALDELSGTGSQRECARRRQRRDGFRDPAAAAELADPDERLLLNPDTRPSWNARPLPAVLPHGRDGRCSRGWWSPWGSSAPGAPSTTS